MGLHEDIKAAASDAIPAVTNAASGSEWGINDLPRAVAGLVDVLLRYDRLRDELRRRGITVHKEHPQPLKFV
jgi:hypothetical protein